ncbi:CCA tRNA nucleotidyltransferase [Granulicatella seriolae]|uniref:CCA-adding enzyme n=1 Tax=Granulicatella seriolae TaxID=2967226 RepID=A0ABT1WP67_9LACT|nr:CCA tRNA nucleotidyltransferase [Granulicatella seriolae]
MIESSALFIAAKPIIQKIIDHGYEAYFVGGAVRDSLLNKPVSDVDIATSATPLEIKAIFTKTFDVGIEHGTVLVYEQGVGYEITTFRTESNYEDFRHPSSVSFVRSLEEDLKRRDFTINALALSIDDRVIDYFGGQEDLARQLLRSVGLAQERFSEDALRMFRAIRFVSQLDFAVDPETIEAIRLLKANLSHVAVERIQVEWVKTLVGPARNRAIKLLVDTGLYEYCPKLADQKENLLSFSENTFPQLSTFQAWVLLCHYLGFHSENVRPFLKAWKLSNKVLDETQAGLGLLHERFTRKWNFFMAFSHPLHVSLEVEALLPSLGYQDESQFLENVYKELPIESLKQLAFNGKDIQELLNLKKSGPIIGQSLTYLKNAVLNQEVKNTKEDLQDYLLSADFIKNLYH